MSIELDQSLRESGHVLCLREHKPYILLANIMRYFSKFGITTNNVYAIAKNEMGLKFG